MMRLGKPGLDEEFFGRRKRRRFGEGNSGIVRGANFVEMSRGAKNKRKGVVGKIEFLRLDLHIGFFFRLFVFRDFFAKAARMFAVKCAQEGSLERGGL